MSETSWLVLAAAFGVSVAAPVAVKPWLIRRGVLDNPSARSSHNIPTVRGGGIGITVAMALGLLAAAASGISEPWMLLLTASAALAAAIIGWREDDRGLPIAIRAAGQFLVGFSVGVTLGLALAIPIWLVVAVGIYIAAYINIANFMDGVNLISSLHAGVVGGSYALLGWLEGDKWLIFPGLLIGTVFVAFVPWNVAGSRMFLGDVGSYLLGATLGTMGAIAVATGAPIFPILAPASIYLADTSVTLVRRVVARKKWHQPHRDHTYHRLEDAGLSHLLVAAIVTIWSIGASALGLLSLALPPAGAVLCVVGVAILVAAYMLLPALVNSRNRRLSIEGRPNG